MSDNNYKSRADDADEEWDENIIADSEAIDNALDKMLANKKLVVKFKQKKPENDNIKVMHAVEDREHNNESITPINDYESMHVSYPYRIPNESPEEANQVNMIDKRDMEVKKIYSLDGKDHAGVISESHETPELIMVTKIFNKKVIKKPILRNEHVLKNKNLCPYKDKSEMKPQSREGNTYKHVLHKKNKRESKKVPKQAEITDDEDSNYEKKLNKHYKTQLKEREIVKKAAPHRNADDDSLSTENNAYKKKQEAKIKLKTTTTKIKKHRKKHKKPKRVHKKKKEKKTKKTVTKRDTLRNGDNDLLSYSLKKPKVLDTVEIKIANPIHSVKHPKRGKKHVNVNDGTVTERNHKTTHKVKKIHISSKLPTHKYKIKHKDVERNESVEVHSNVRDESHESSAAKSIPWENSENIDPADLTRTNHEKKDLNSYEELLKENDIISHPKLPFYLSTIKLTSQKKKYTKKYSVHLTTTIQEKTTTRQEKLPLRHIDNENQQNKNYEIDMNATLHELASSKMLDQLTEKIATQMLQKLQKRLEDNGLRALGIPDHDNETVEQIEILFNNDGSMQVMNNKRDDVNGTMLYFENFNAKRMRPANY
ncbi:uncharacterized protein LOC111360810 isoform X2 [Spodoptera litura]|nr:uncharacterized protein LOC111360810 isoform X2 [Spodoptera litura]XP_022832819.1 uncharacterized protein LOC111360810 isoform X2 [Spodoptera litura]